MGGPNVQLYIKSAVQPWGINGDSAGLNAMALQACMAYDPCIHEDNFGEDKFPYNPLFGLGEWSSRRGPVQNVVRRPNPSVLPKQPGNS